MYGKSGRSAPTDFYLGGIRQKNQAGTPEPPQGSAEIRFSHRFYGLPKMPWEWGMVGEWFCGKNGVKMKLLSLPLASRPALEM